ncbi:hypothetical protein [Streptomyces sp. NPDC054797]
MTDFMVQIPADWLARVFLSMRRGVSDDAKALATELRPFTEKPGQRGPVPRATVLRTELALRGEIDSAGEESRRARLSEEAAHLIKTRLVRESLEGHGDAGGGGTSDTGATDGSTGAPCGRHWT